MANEDIKKQDERDKQLEEAHERELERMRELEEWYVATLEEAKKQTGLPSTTYKDGHVFIDQKVEFEDEMIDEANKIIHENFWNKLSNEEYIAYLIKLNEEQVLMMHFTPQVLAQLAGYYALHPEHKIPCNLENGGSEVEPFYKTFLFHIKKLSFEDCMFAWKQRNVGFEHSKELEKRKVEHNKIRDILHEEANNAFIEHVGIPTTKELQSSRFMNYALQLSNQSMFEEISKTKLKNYYSDEREIIDMKTSEPVSITEYKKSFESNVDSKHIGKTKIELVLGFLNDEDYEAIKDMPPISFEHFTIQDCIASIVEGRKENNIYAGVSYYEIAKMYLLGKREPRKTDIDFVKKCIQHLRRVDVTIDARDEYKYNTRDDSIFKRRINEHLVNAVEASVEAKNGTEMGGLFVYSTPILHRYCDGLGHVISVNNDMKKFFEYEPLSIERRNLYFGTLRRIAQMNNKRNKVNYSTITFASIAKYVDSDSDRFGISKATRIKKCKEVELFLKHLTKIKEIKGYKWNRKDQQFDIELYQRKPKN